MLRKVAPAFLAVGLILAASGCASAPRGERYEFPYASFTGDPGLKFDLANTIYQTAQTLAERAVYLDKTRPIIVATVVSIDDLEQSSTFGRLVSQLVANRIAQRGYLVRDITYMHAFRLRKDTGELVLTREASEATAAAKAQAVVSGTYTVGGGNIYLSLRILNASNGELLSSVDVTIPYDYKTAPLVEDPQQARMDAKFPPFERLDRFEQHAPRSAAN